MKIMSAANSNFLNGLWFVLQDSIHSKEEEEHWIIKPLKYSKVYKHDLPFVFLKHGIFLLKLLDWFTFVFNRLGTPLSYPLKFLNKS